MEKLLLGVVMCSLGFILGCCEETSSERGEGMNDWDIDTGRHIMDYSYPSYRAPMYKKSVFGILGLATKRPHKTAAEYVEVKDNDRDNIGFHRRSFLSNLRFPYWGNLRIQHLPPDDAFLPLRGRKRSVGVGMGSGSGLYPQQMMMLPEGYKW